MNLQKLAKSLPRGVDFAASNTDAATDDTWELVSASSNVVDILEGICAHARVHMDGQNRFQYVLAARDTGNVLIGPFRMVYDHDVANFRMFKVEI